MNRPHPPRPDASRTCARLSRGALWASVLLLLPGSLSAQPAAEVPVRWTAPSGCPDAEALAARIATHRDPAAQPVEDIRVVAEVRRRDDGRYLLSLGTAQGAWHGRRSLEDDDCGVLTDAAALLIAVALDGGQGDPAPPADTEDDQAPPPAPEADEPPAPAQAPGPPWPLGWQLGAHVVWDGATLPVSAFGAAMSGRLSWGPLSAGLGVLALAAADGAQVAGGHARADLQAADLSLCYWAGAARVRGGLCAEVELGRYRAWALGLPERHHRETLFHAAGPALWLELPLYAPVFLSAGAGLRFAGVRPALVVQTPAGTLSAHQTAPRSLRLGFGLGLRY